MTAHGRPRKRQRTTAREDQSESSWQTDALDVAVKPLLERLLSFRSQVTATRNEEIQRAAEIQERFDAREAASRAVANVIPPPPSEDIAVFSRGVRVEKDRRRPEVPKVPPLPAMKLLMEQDPPEKLIHEQSIIVRAQAINRKNAELARERLPKQPEAQRNKTYHDYFLDEVLWMAADFREERKWKIQMAKKVSKMVMQYHSQRAQREARAKAEAHQRLVRLANSVARDVRKFWSQIAEIAEYRSSLVEEAKLAKERKSQLKNLLQRTAKYSSVLARSLTNPVRGVDGNGADVEEKQVKFDVASADGVDGYPEDSSERSGPTSGRLAGTPSDQDSFTPEPQSEEDSDTVDERGNHVEAEWHEGGSEEADDEATLIAAEAEESRDANEIQNLERDADVSVEQLLRAQGIDPAQYVADSKTNSNSPDDDDDDESTIRQAEENQERDEMEVRKLQNEADMSVSELLKSQGIDPAAYEADTRQYTKSDSEASDAEDSSTPNPSAEETNGVAAVKAEEPSPEAMGSDEASSAQPTATIGRTQLLGLKGTNSKSATKEKFPQADAQIRSKATLTIADAVQEYRERGEPIERGGPISERSPEKSVSFAEDHGGGHGEVQPIPPGVSRSVPSAPEASANGDIREPMQLLRGTLRDYQRAGMKWLISLYTQKLNGILADEMGLGKTIQTISLLAWLAIEKGVWGPHLIVVPTSVMVNWEVEFKKWLPGFKILTYFGSMKERKLKRQGWTKPNKFHVCITSYTLAVQDATALRRKKWVYLILDEAHNIKNFESQRWQTLLSFPSQSRLLITGTPLQNSVMELWSLMHFLMPDLFESHSEFKDWFSKPVVEAASEDESRGGKSEIVTNLHDVLRPFLLRRLKADVEKGLPPKFEHIVKCPLSKRQRQLYEDFMARSDIRDTLQNGDFFSVMNILMQLRKVCNHPDLFEGRQILSPFAMKAVFYPIPKMAARVLVKPPEKAINLDLLCLDLCSLERTWAGRWHSEEAQRISAQSCIRGELLSIGGFDGNVEDTKKEEYTPRRAANHRADSFRRSQLRYQAQLTAMRIRQHALLGQDLRDACMMSPSSLVQALRSVNPSALSVLPVAASGLIRTIDEVAQRAKPIAERFVCCITKVSAPSVELRYRDDDQFHASNDESLSMFNRSSQYTQALFRPFHVRSKVTIPDTRLIQWDCGKLQVLDRLLRRLRDASSRVLIFTQMTKVLDVLESFLNLHSLRYLRLDGTTKTDDRQKVVERFNTDTRIFCMILTTRAGGIGLNLTGADAVVFYDTDYNPAIDNQAQDRAHRIGQTKPVNIYRLVSEQTVEENILRRANEKRTLESLVISRAGFTTEAIAGQNNQTSEAPSNGTRDPRDARPIVSSSAEAQPLRNGMTETKDGQITIQKAATGRHGSTAVSREAQSAQSIRGGISTSYGQFNGFGASPGSNTGDQRQSDKTLDTLQYQDVTFKLMAAEDDRETLAAFTAEQEEQDMRAEFDEGMATAEGTSPSQEQETANDERGDVESPLNPVQRYALRLVESWQSSSCDLDEPETVVDWESEFTVSKMLQRRKEVHSLNEKSSDGIVKAADFQEVSTPESEVEDDDPMFYEMDISAKGQESYLKGLTDTDADIKMYLPLRDGGPEELKISTVVSGTAAAGLECAEDAAFFPHAYNRMSRTIYATQRQKEKAKANLKKRRAEKEKKRRELEETAALAEKEKELARQASLERAKFGKQRVEANRSIGAPSNKKRMDGAQKAKGAVVSSLAAGIDGVAGSNGLFKRVSKKPTKRLPLSVGKAGISGAGGVNPGEGIGLNDAWTREEEIKAIRTFSENSSMRLIADTLALNPRVRAGLRRRRGERHCLSRLAGLQKEAKSGPILPKAAVSDGDIIRKHFKAAAASNTKLQQTPPSWLLLPSIPTAWHPSQSKVINEARSKTVGRFDNAVVPTLSSVTPSIQLPPHFKAGYKPTETTPQALNRKRYPFLRPPREESRPAPQRSGSSSRTDGAHGGFGPGHASASGPSRATGKLPKGQTPMTNSRAPGTNVRIGPVRVTSQPRPQSGPGQAQSSRVPDIRTTLPKPASSLGPAIRKSFTPGTSARMSIGQVGGSVQNPPVLERTVGGVVGKVDSGRKAVTNKISFGASGQLKSGKVAGIVGRSPGPSTGVVASNGITRATGTKTETKNGLASSSAGVSRHTMASSPVAGVRPTVANSSVGVGRPAVAGSSGSSVGVGPPAVTSSSAGMSRPVVVSTSGVLSRNVVVGTTAVVAGSSSAAAGNGGKAIYPVNMQAHDAQRAGAKGSLKEAGVSAIPASSTRENEDADGGKKDETKDGV